MSVDVRHGIQHLRYMSNRHGPHWIDNDTCRFSLWAPDHASISLTPEGSLPIPMLSGGDGWHHLDMINPPESMHYRFAPQDGDWLLPDPASHHQPEGVDGPSALVRHQGRSWRHSSPDIPPERLVLYELHIGTFTPEGTFEAAAERVSDLAAMGITAVEVMPVAQFSGDRNWGYDGVFPYAVQHSYGGPEGLRRFVDAAHGAGLAVFLDVVFNHLGPEGNVLGRYAPYFSSVNHTPWGPNLDFARRAVRSYVIQNCLHWFLNYRIDGLRLDAVQCIPDESRTHVLRELADLSRSLGKRLGRRFHIIAESDENDMSIIRPYGVRGGRYDGGLNLHGQWTDDYHHSLHAALTGERVGFYGAFSVSGRNTSASVAGVCGALLESLRNGFHYRGQYNAWRGKRVGTDSTGYAETAGFTGDSIGESSGDSNGEINGESSGDGYCGVKPHELIVYSQNHDMVGNRPKGERLHHLVPHAAARCAAALTLLSPYTPLLFMGEEYAEDAPFQFFTSYTASSLKQAVSRGRNRELRAFGWQEKGAPPSDIRTFKRCVLNWNNRDKGVHGTMLAWYSRCLHLRHNHPAFLNGDRRRMLVCQPVRGVLAMGRWDADESVYVWLVCNLTPEPATFRTGMLPRIGRGEWSTLLCSSEHGVEQGEFLDGVLSPWGCLVIERSGNITTHE